MLLENKTIIKVQAYGNIYSMKYMGKTTDTFLWLKILLPQTLSLLAKSYAAGRANNIELLMLVSDF